MATEILKKQTIVGTDAQYEANRNSYGEGTVFESTSLLGESDIDPTYTNKFVERKTSTTGLYAYCFDQTGITKTRYVSEGYPAYSLVERDQNGRVRTADPEGQNDAVTKAYADNRFRYTHLISVEFKPVDEYTACKGTILYVSSNSTPITDITTIPTNIELPFHGWYPDGTPYTIKRTSGANIELTYWQQDNGSGANLGTTILTFTIITDTVL